MLDHSTIKFHKPLVLKLILLPDEPDNNGPAIAAHEIAISRTGRLHIRRKSLSGHPQIAGFGHANAPLPHDGRMLYWPLGRFSASQLICIIGKKGFESHGTCL